MRFEQWKRVIAGTASDVNRNCTLFFAAALSYYLVLAFFPALIALAAVVAYLPIPDLFNTVIATLGRVMPPESMGLVRRIVADAVTPHHGAFLSFGVIGMLWTLSDGFAAMIEALNFAYNVPETRSMWRTRALSFQLTFLIGSLSTLAFAFMIVGPRFGEFLAAHTGMSRAFALTWPVLRYVLTAIFMVLAVEGLYFMAPNVRQNFHATLPGAIFAVITWILLSDALSVYFQKFAHLNRTYGVLGGGIALLVWLYWSGFVILLGAGLNGQLIQERGERKLDLKQPLRAKTRPRLAAAADEATPVA